jgi:peptidoglycan hydrolase-like protein with peptidoglycan-binding domain
MTALLAGLESELQTLLAQAAAKGVSMPGTSSSFTFTRNLTLYDTGADVTALQQLLINAASGPAAQALAHHGVTKTFGILTYNALKEFQKAVGIVPASGYFGPKTRAYVNANE